MKRDINSMNHRREVLVNKKDLVTRKTTADPKYVIQRIHIGSGRISYLSPGKINWITEEIHQQYRTRYGKWFWNEAQEISHKLNKIEGSGYEYITLPARNHQ